MDPCGAGVAVVTGDQAHRRQQRVQPLSVGSARLERYPDQRVSELDALVAEAIDALVPS